jgi:hypothetical protein
MFAAPDACATPHSAAAEVTFWSLPAASLPMFTGTATLL